MTGMLAYHPTGRWIAACRNRGIRVPGEVRVFDVTSGDLVFTLRGHTSNITSVTFSPDGRRIASGSYDGTVKLWETETGKEVFTLRGHTGGVLCVAFSSDGRRLAAGSIDHTVKIWDAPRVPEDRETPARRDLTDFATPAGDREGNAR
jgi:WD40 repeat protein